MSYAKVNKNKLVIYPYSYENLREENPYSEYDNRFSLSEWYEQTEEASNLGFKLVEVVLEIQPEFDNLLESIFLQDTPKLTNDVWTIGWEIKKRTTPADVLPI